VSEEYIIFFGLLGDHWILFFNGREWDQLPCNSDAFGDEIVDIEAAGDD